MSPEAPGATPAKPPESDAPEEAGDLVQVLEVLAPDGHGDATELTWRHLLAAPGTWAARALAFGALGAVPWCLALAGATGEGSWLTPLPFLAALALPALGAGAHAALLRRGELRASDGLDALARALPAFLLHLLAALALGASLPAGLAGIGWALLAFSWATTVGEVAVMDRGPLRALTRGPARAAGYLLRLPGRVLRNLRRWRRGERGPHPRLVQTLGFWAVAVGGAAILGTALVTPLASLLGALPGLPWVLAEGVPMALYFAGLALALDAGAAGWTLRYLEHQRAVGALGEVPATQRLDPPPALEAPPPLEAPPASE